MTDPWEVPAERLISKLAQQLQGKIAEPSWSKLVRTGTHTERAPVQVDWWYVRSASVMRKLYRLGPVGVSRLAAEYGGRKDNGSAPYHAVKGSRSIVQEVFHELEKAGLVSTNKSKGRILSPKGQSMIQKVAKETLTDMAQKDPSLKKYL